MASPVLFYDGRIITLDPQAPRVEAMAAADGRIVATGTREQCRSKLEGTPEEIGLGGSWVIPGLTDSHIHFSSYARGLRDVHLEDTASLDEALELVRERVSRLGPGEWVLGGRWDYNRWGQKAPPDKRSLDRVAPENPIALSSRDGHSMWANSAALRAANIGPDTPDPDGGKIVRYEGGREPTGLLQENAQHLVWAALEGVERPSLANAIREAFPLALAAGLTSIQDFDGVDAIEAYQQLHDSGELRLRVYKTIPVSALDWAIERGMRTRQGDEWLRTGPVKIFTDGALGSHTAAMLQPYRGEPENYGIVVTPPEELYEQVSRAASHGISAALHAIGDLANRNALDAFERLRREGIGQGMRHRIEHVQHVAPVDLPRLAQLGVVASMQPIHATSDMYVADELLGDRELYSYAWNSLARTGARLAFGSDCPVEPLDPFLGIHAAVTRQRDSRPEEGWQPQERITAEQALRAYTEGAAFASYEETIKGRLAPGMLADFVLISDSPLECAPEDVLRIEVLATYVGGEKQYQS